MDIMCFECDSFPNVWRRDRTVGPNETNYHEQKWVWTSRASKVVGACCTRCIDKVPNALDMDGEWVEGRKQCW